MDNISEQEINLLLDALDAWVESDQKDETLFSMFGMMVSGSKENAEGFLEETKTDREKAKSQKKLRQERAILIKAKLITLRDKLEAKSFEDEVLKR